MSLTPTGPEELLIEAVREEECVAAIVAFRTFQEIFAEQAE